MMDSLGIQSIATLVVGTIFALLFWLSLGVKWDWLIYLLGVIALVAIASGAGMGIGAISAAIN